MHQGEYKGKNADSKAKRILILGESHHWSAEDWELLPNETEEQAKERRRKKAKNYTTEKIVENYLENYKTHDNRASAYRFFDKIVLSFGIDPEQQRDEFWSNVYFGNYVEVLCGIKDGVAKETLKKESGGRTHREIYNDNLFNFINKNKIDVVVCFGRMVFDNLPSLSKEHLYEESPKKNGEIVKNGKIKEGIKIGKSNDYIGKCIYLPNIDHKNTKVILEKRLEAYSLRHPSAAGGYNPENYVDVLKELL